MSARLLSSSVFFMALALASGMPVSIFADEIPWSTDIEAALRHASSTGQPVLMEFTAPWCVYCKRMEKTTFVDPSVVDYVNQRFVPVRVDADQNKQLVTDLGIKGLPALLVVSPELKIIERIPGFQTPEALLTKLDRVPTAADPSVTRQDAAAIQQAASTQQSKPPGLQMREELEFEPIETTKPAPRNPAASVRPVSQPAAVEVEFEQDSSKTSADHEFFASIDQKKPALEVNVPGTRTSAAKSAFFDGACIVCAVENREIAAGSPKHQVMYRGHMLFFSNDENKEKFLAQPADYWPMLDGVCAVTLLNDEQESLGQLEYAAFFRKRLWVFSSEENMKQFLDEPAEVAEEIEEMTQARAK